MRGLVGRRMMVSAAECDHVVFEGLGRKMEHPRRPCNECCGERRRLEAGVSRRGSVLRSVRCGMRG